MKAVILAAGTGSRLGMSAPKSLALLINGKTILDYQVEKISKFVPVGNIYVVVGYKKEMIMQRYPQLIYVHNDAYAETNTGRSLLTALNEIEEDDVLWLNGDVVFDERLISRLIATNNSCVLVDSKTCGAEEVKYTTDSERYIRNISKEVFPAEGEALGMNLVRKKDLPIFKKNLALIDRQDYFEKAIENMISEENIGILAINSSGLFCHEIDFPQDLEYVRQYLLETQCT